MQGGSVEIDSPQNEQIKRVVKLRENRSFRDETSLFIIEGYRELLRAESFEIRELFYCPDFFLKDNEPTLIERIRKSGTEIIKCSKRAFEKLSYRDRPDGLLAVAVQKKWTLNDLSSPTFLVAAESIEKPGNLGTILRSSDGASVDALIVLDPCTDIYNPNTVRASVGTLFTRPVITTSSKEFVSFLRKSKITLVATTPHSKLNYVDANFSDPVAIVIGSEQYGLSSYLLSEAEVKVSIPMLGVADSLNAAMAATIVIYEVLRQRSISR